MEREGTYLGWGRFNDFQTGNIPKVKRKDLSFAVNLMNIILEIIPTYSNI